MGGGYYDRDVTPPGSTADFENSLNTRNLYSNMADDFFYRQSIHNDLKPEKILNCKSKNPIVCAIDVTGSMGNWAKVIWDKMPMFYGQILMQGYLQDPALSFAAVGDANTDEAPVQICEFMKGDNIDNELNKIWIEGNGGAQAKESYELVAWYYANKCEMEKTELAFFFFTGDEGFYPITESRLIKQYFDNSVESLDSLQTFADLKKKFNVFYIHKQFGTYGGIGSENERIVKQWNQALCPENVLLLNDPKAVVDVILGAIAITSKSRNLDSYLIDMKKRGQDNIRLQIVQNALKLVSPRQEIVKIDPVFPNHQTIIRKGINKKIQ